MGISSQSATSHRRHRARRGCAERSEAFGLPADVALRFQEWRGASGRRYVHVVYQLVDCPAVSSANYALVRQDATGGHRVLKIGRTFSDAPTLNRAQIRHEAALLGANEVHLHLLAKSETERIRVEFDLGGVARPTDGSALADAA